MFKSANKTSRHGSILSRREQILTICVYSEKSDGTKLLYICLSNTIALQEKEADIKQTTPSIKEGSKPVILKYHWVFWYYRLCYL
jgi:hypothetical protein